MKIEMTAQISGTRDGVEWPPVGGSLTVGDGEGADLVRAGYAKRAEKSAVEPVVEKATARKAETRKGLTTKDL